MGAFDAMSSSFCTERTLAVPFAMFPMLSRAAWSGTSPVKSTTPL